MDFSEFPIVYREEAITEVGTLRPKVGTMMFLVFNVPRYNKIMNVIVIKLREFKWYFKFFYILKSRVMFNDTYYSLSNNKK